MYDSQDNMCNMISSLTSCTDHTRLVLRGYDSSQLNCHLHVQFGLPENKELSADHDPIVEADTTQHNTNDYLTSFNYN